MHTTPHQTRLSQQSLTGVGGKRRRKATQASAEAPRTTPLKVVEAYKTLDPSSVEIKKDILQGLEICVIGDFDLGSVSDEEGDISPILWFIQQCR